LKKDNQVFIDLLIFVEIIPIMLSLDA